MSDDRDFRSFAAARFVLSLRREKKRGERKDNRDGTSKSRYFREGELHDISSTFF